MTEQFRPEERELDPQVAELFTKLGDVNLERIITPDGLIESKALESLGILATSIQELLLRLFDGDFCVKEWRKLAPSLKGLLNGREHWAAKTESATGKLPPGLPNKKRYGSNIRTAKLGKRGPGRYSSGRR